MIVILFSFIYSFNINNLQESCNEIKLAYYANFWYIKVRIDNIISLSNASK